VANNAIGRTPCPPFCHDLIDVFDPGGFPPPPYHPNVPAWGGVVRAQAAVLRRATPA
jgi:hypothetical protein